MMIDDILKGISTVTIEKPEESSQLEYMRSQTEIHKGLLSLIAQQTSAMEAMTSQLQAMKLVHSVAAPVAPRPQVILDPSKLMRPIDFATAKGAAWARERSRLAHLAREASQFSKREGLEVKLIYPGRSDFNVIRHYTVKALEYGYSKVSAHIEDQTGARQLF